ncbi:MAG TPA: hypothetical protein VFQ61_02395 [Polyangiaceae bacterium]|nr:hypothetical protein [Polyangiaceae bacterium]
MEKEVVETAATAGTPPVAQPRTTRGIWLLVGVIGCWLLLAWLKLRAERPVYDWMSWRQADTQAIARHFLEPGSNWLWPRIDWGGAGPGYVETEFQLYTGLVSLLLRAFGENEWAGQALSLAISATTAGLIARWLLRRLGLLPALFGVVAWLSVRSVLLLSTAVMPDGLALLLYVSAWFGFCHYLEADHSDGRLENYSSAGPLASLAKPYWGLVAFGVCGALAMLVKPTTAHLGISSAVLVILLKPRELAKPTLWLVWLGMLGTLGAYLFHAKQLYAEYGNTFGILSGGDSKLPKPEHLLMPRLHALAFGRFVNFGLGPAGALAVLALGVTRLRQRAFWSPGSWASDEARWLALLVGNLAIVPLSFRYLANGAGAHYVAPASLLGASAVAQWVARLRRGTNTPPRSDRTEPSSPKPRTPLALLMEKLRRLAVAMLGALLLLQLALGIRVRLMSNRDAQSVALAELGEAVASQASSTSKQLLVVRTGEPEFDAFYRTPNNFEDPRVFYAARMRGFAIGADADTPARLEAARKQGARFFVDSALEPRGPRTEAWLRQHARPLAHSSSHPSLDPNLTTSRSETERAPNDQSPNSGHRQPELPVTSLLDVKARIYRLMP